MGVSDVDPNQSRKDRWRRVKQEEIEKDQHGGIEVDEKLKETW